MNNRLVLWIILASATLTVMAGAIIAPVLNLIRDGVGADPASAGLIITTHALFIALFSPIVGSIIDKIGTKKPFVFGLVLYGLAGSSGLFITSYWLLIISRAILGIAVAAIFTSLTLMILNLYEGKKKDKVMGWRSSANSFGGIIWPLIGGFLGGFSWHAPFAIYSLGIIIGIISFIAVPETHKEHIKNAKGSVWKVLNPTIFAIYCLMFFGMILLYAIVVFLPQLLERFGISDPFHISLFISVLAISGGSTSLIYQKIRSKLSSKLIVMVAFALWASGFIIISQTFNALLIILSVVLIGISQGMIFPSVMLWLGEMAEASFRGRIISYAGSFGLIGQFLSPVILGQVFLLLGIRGVFLLPGLVCALLFLLVLVVIFFSKQTSVS